MKRAISAAVWTKRKVAPVARRFGVSLVPGRIVDRWADNKDFVFVLAIGRSGTKFLASVLTRAEDAYIAHEPVRDDFEAYQDAFHSEAAARDYVLGFRRKEIFVRARNREIEIYGEVNSLLRRHVTALREAFPRATFLHLVRNGATVVRSMMARKTMTDADISTRRIYPAPTDPWYEEWAAMTRFERLCWYWQNENRYLRELVPSMVKFEDILSSYESFEDSVSAKTGLRISREVWKASVRRPVNTTTVHRVPGVEDWDRTLRNAFARICGEEMREHGYEIPAG